MNQITFPDVVSRRLSEARSAIRRYSPEQALDELLQGTLLVDLRPWEYRFRFGEIPGAVAVSRHVLEWRLDVQSEWRLKELSAGDAGQRLILLCDEGYTSSLAAYQVKETLGLTDVGDVKGGFKAWLTAGLPTVPRSTVLADGR
ncbi:rhodanese-like domain-containing protein [Amycolatopsis japonica]